MQERQDLSCTYLAHHELESSIIIIIIMQERDVIVLPRKPDHVSKSWTAKLTITKTLEFSSQTLRSGVVVMADDALPGSALLFIRGAPGIIKDLVQPSSVPADFEQVWHSVSLMGNESTFCHLKRLVQCHASRLQSVLFLSIYVM